MCALTYPHSHSLILSPLSLPHPFPSLTPPHCILLSLSLSLVFFPPFFFLPLLYLRHFPFISVLPPSLVASPLHSSSSSVFTHALSPRPLFFLHHPTLYTHTHTHTHTHILSYHTFFFFQSSHLPQLIMTHTSTPATPHPLISPTHTIPFDYLATCRNYIYSSLKSNMKFLFSFNVSSLLCPPSPPFRHCLPSAGELTED